MALYRNIAGVNPFEQQVGLVGIHDSAYYASQFAPAPIETTTPAPTTTDATTAIPPLVPTGTLIPLSPTTVDQIRANTAIEMKGRYDWIMANTPYDIDHSGNIYVDATTEDLFQCDPTRTKCSSWLPLDWIQEIENQSGTAGTLFMHMNLPLIAKDTAGYGGGSKASTGSTTMYSTPIADVLAIPAAPTGPNVIENYTPQTTSVPGATPMTNPSGTPTTTTPVTTSQHPVSTSTNTVGLLALGLAALAVVKKKRLLLVGGVGLLYYSMVKK